MVAEFKIPAFWTKIYEDYHEIYFEPFASLFAGHTFNHKSIYFIQLFQIKLYNYKTTSNGKHNAEQLILFSWFVLFRKMAFIGNKSVY